MSSRVLDRYLLRETVSAWVGVIVVLLLVMLSTRFARLLSDAAAGEIPRGLLFRALGLSTLQYLVVLIPISQLLAVMLSLGRLYRDNEIAAMTGCGVSLGRLYRPFVLSGVLLALFTAWLSFGVGPWAGRYGEYVIKDARRLIQYTPFEPGRFRAVAGGRAVFYTAELDPAQGKLTTVFGQLQEGKEESVIIAAEGRQRVDEDTGDREITLLGGYRYAGIPGEAAYDIVRFEEFSTRVTPPEFLYTPAKVKVKPTSELLRSEDLDDLGELHWRAAAPLSVLLLTLLAVPLSHVAPRQGRYGKLVIGIVLYLVYANLLGVGQNGIANGTIPGAAGLWWIHAIMLLGATVLIARRQGWLQDGGRRAVR